MKTNKKVLLVFGLLLVCNATFALDILGGMEALINRLPGEEARISQVESAQNKSAFLETSINYPFFMGENLSEYVKYQSENQNLSYAEVVAFVNLGMQNGGQVECITNLPANLFLVNEKYVLQAGFDVESFAETLKPEIESAFLQMQRDMGLPLYIGKFCEEKARQGAFILEENWQATEHALCLALDFCTENSATMPPTDFEYTAQYRWLAANAYKYGFVLRHEVENLGEDAPLWHWRYVGAEVAAQMQSEGIKTLEQYLGMYYYAYFIQ